MLSVRPNVNFFCRRHPRANVQLHPIMQIKWLLTRLKTATRTIKRTVQIVPLKVKFDLTSCRATDTPVRRLNVMIMVWYTSVQTHLPPVLIMGLWLNLKQQLGLFSVNLKKDPITDKHHQAQATRHCAPPRPNLSWWSAGIGIYIIYFCQK